MIKYKGQFIIAALIVGFCLFTGCGKTVSNKVPDVEKEQLIRKNTLRAIAQREKEIELNPNDNLLTCRKSWVNANAYLVRIGDYEKAIKWFWIHYNSFKMLTIEEKQQLMFWPDGQIDAYEAETLTDIGGCYFLLGDLEKAREMWEKVVQDYPDESSANVCRAFLEDLQTEPGRIQDYYRILLSH